MQPKESDAGGGSGVSREEKASFTLDNDNSEIRRGRGGEDSCGPTHNGQKNMTCNNELIFVSARQYRDVILAQYLQLQAVSPEKGLLA